MLGRILTAACLAAAIAGPANAQDSKFTVQMMTPETALKLAEAALKDCRGKGFQVGVSVVDRSGNLQVLLRDRYAGVHTPETSRRKAWTAVSFRTDTVELEKLVHDDPGFAGLKQVPGALVLGGGAVVQAGGVYLGGVGVSGAPGGAEDHNCAKAGIAAVEDDLNF